MPVYFCQAGEGGPIKIGFTTMVRKRIYELQVAHHLPLTLLAVEEAPRSREAELHNRFRADLLRGEWFKASVGLVAYIAGLPKPRPKRMPRPKLLYVWQRNGDTGNAFRGPVEDGVNYLNRNVVHGDLATFLDAAFRRIDADDPDDWPQWWLDYLRTRRIQPVPAPQPQDAT